MERYSYRSLTDNDSIRVFELQPGRPGDVLKGRLLEVQLRNKSTFDALSYCWGEPKFDSLLICEGRAMYITEGLMSALDGLRHVDIPTIIWIDQICVVQSDLEERNCQVQLMGQIYSTARQVYIWVGPATDSSIFMLECEARGTVEYAETPRFLSAVVEFFERSWFDRTWTLQEVVLAIEEPRVCYGVYQLSWAHLHRFITTIASRCFSSPDTPSDDGVFDIIDNKSIGDSKNWTSYLEDMDEVRVIEAYDACISNILKAQDNMQAVTDPRDKVFGLLSLCEFKADPILADYRKTTARVYSEVMAFIILDDFVRGYTVHTLQLSTKQPSKSLPTWVPDFSAQSSAQTGWFNPISLQIFWLQSLQLTVSTALAKRSLASFSDNFETLRTEGSIIGTIVEFLSLAQYRDRPVRFSGYDQWLSRILVIVLTRRLRPNDILMSLYRPELDALEQRDNVLFSLERLLARVESGKRLDSDREDWDFFVSSIRDMLRSVAPDNIDLTFFVTDTGRTGLCAGPIAEGDIVAGLFYVNMPSILRKKDENFTMVTLAHVGGLVFEYNSAETMSGAADTAMSSFQEFVIV